MADQPRNMDEERWEQFAELRDSALQTARAWGYKEHAMMGVPQPRWARKAWLAIGDPLSAGAGQARGTHDQAPPGRE